MNDKTKTDDADEPIDAEFETLDTNGEAAPSGAQAGINKLVLRFGPLSLVFVGVAVLALFAASYVIFSGRDTPENQSSTVEIASLSTRLDALQGEMNTLQSREKAVRQKITARLGTLENAAPAPVTDPSVLADLTQRLEQVEQQAGAAIGNETSNSALDAMQERISTLENANGKLALANPAPAIVNRLGTLESQLAALQNRLLTLKMQASQKGGNTVLLLRIMALDDAAQTGAPFTGEWQSVSQLLPQNTDVHILDPLARTGVPGRATLARSFAQQINAIRMAGDTANKKPGIMAKTRRAFSGLVSVRRIDGKAKGVDAVLANAQAALNDNNLRGAVQLLGQLDGEAAKAAQNWLTQAQARLTLETAITRLKSAVAEAGP